MLRQPVRLRIFLINIHLSAVDGRIYVRVAVDADEVIRRPLIRQPHALGQTGGIACAEDFFGCAAAQPHLKPRVCPQKISQIHADRVGHILFEQTAAFRAGVRTGRIVSLIDKNLDRQSITSSCQPMRQRGRTSVLDGQHTPCYSVRKERWDQYEIIYQTKGILLGGSVYRF